MAASTIGAALVGAVFIISPAAAGSKFDCTAKAREMAQAIDDQTIPPMKVGETAVISSIVVQKDGRVGMCGRFLGCFDATKLSFVTPCGFVSADKDAETGTVTLYVYER